MTAWSKEPWRTAQDAPARVETAEGREILVATKSDPKERVRQRANAARAAQCVTACAGIADPEAAIQAARDELARLENAVLCPRCHENTRVRHRTDCTLAVALALLRPLPKEEGWTWITGSPRWHYFRSSRSLCKKWLGLCIDPAEIQKDDRFGSPDNCKICERARKKEIVRE